MRALGERGRPRGRLPADRHGPAARRSRRQRARGARGARRPCAATARRTSPSSCSTAARGCSPSPISGSDVDEGRSRAEAAVADGSAEAAWIRWIEAQGGTADESALEQAPVVREVTAPRDGAIVRLDAIRVGVAALHLGAGRRVKGDTIDHAVGVVCRRKRGDARRGGRRPRRDPRPRRGRRSRRPRERSLAAYELGDERRRQRPVLLEVIDVDDRCRRGAASVFACRSCPRSRASGAVSRPSSRGGGSSGSRSWTRGSRVRSIPVSSLESSRASESSPSTGAASI